MHIFGIRLFQGRPHLWQIFPDIFSIGLGDVVRRIAIDLRRLKWISFTENALKPFFTSLTWTSSCTMSNIVAITRALSIFILNWTMKFVYDLLQSVNEANGIPLCRYQRLNETVREQEHHNMSRECMRLRLFTSCITLCLSIWKWNTHKHELITLRRQCIRRLWAHWWIETQMDSFNVNCGTCRSQKWNFEFTALWEHSSDLDSSAFTNLK